MIYARDAALLRSIEHELFGERISSHVVHSLGDVIANLTLVPPPWPHYLIVDAAEISSADVRLLGAIREAGWHGIVIVIGEASAETCQSLGIDVVLPRSFGNEVLRNALKHAALTEQAARDQRRTA